MHNGRGENDGQQWETGRLDGSGRRKRCRRQQVQRREVVTAAPEHCYAAKVEVMEEEEGGFAVAVGGEQWVEDDGSAVTVTQSELNFATATINGVLSTW